MTANDLTFTVSIHLGNAEMMAPDDVANALRSIAGRLDALDYHPGHSQTIFDTNGNDVGRWRVPTGITNTTND